MDPAAVTDFANFDSRGYRTVGVERGYGEWAATYESSVENAMDVELLEQLDQVEWGEVRVAADLGCGTGRTGAWLAAKGVAEIDGVDLTAEMLEKARRKGLYRRLLRSDVAATGLDSGAYDLAVACLLDEHLAQLAPIYAEARRLSREGGAFVLVGLHPHFIMASGMPTHFDSASGEPLAIETHVHLLSDHVEAALAAGWQLAELRERLIDEEWVRLKPGWERFRGQPISFAAVWRTA